MKNHSEQQFYTELEKQSHGYLTLETRAHIDGLPIFSFEIVSPDVKNKETLPVLGLIAGVHGIEAVGVKVLNAFVEHIIEQLKWDKHLQELLKCVRIVGIPVLNPTGYRDVTRSNFRGVDLMRNAPVECENPVPLIGGQSYTSKLPYYRGNGTLEVESQVLVDFVESVKSKSPFSIFIDVHSGFGTTDYLWTPYAKQKEPPHNWPDYLALKKHLDATLKRHVYKFEKQSETYCTSGDLWDYLFDRHTNHSQIFLPLTLEIGSWNWIKKSPYMAFRLKNFFNPVHLHRKYRVQRRHRTLFEFLLRIAANSSHLFSR